MSAVDEIVDKSKYLSLLAKALPQVIHTETENERCIAELKALDSRRNPSIEEQRLAELLTLLIEHFEEKQYALPAASPIDVIRHLMDANGLRQTNMTEVFGTPSITSEILSGKRPIAKAHIEKLAAKFNVSPELFFARRRSKLQ